ncbi:AAA domain-containing protein [Halovenus aranensis]|uniref:AAA domain-containing protein n=1 Tax=Halovenus aranensis TaxID=890420 RepID=A0A1G8ZBL4_9EURY|nr:AAA domain-containing protein [Halovenus aranensis]SDK11550.1 AAA domain-containing protein [Halovenus aranensis]
MGQPQPDGGATEPLSEGPAGSADSDRTMSDRQASDKRRPTPSFGVVTPHNAQRGALESVLPKDVTANTVKKYQGGERDIIAVSATVSDPEFARREERVILNPRRLLVAISRSRLLAVVVCSTALFEVTPEDSDHLDDGPVWARLFTQAIGRNAEPVLAGSFAEFTPASIDESADVLVSVYPSRIDIDGGDR